MNQPDFPGTERYSGGDPNTAAFTIAAMFTNSHARPAERLRRSLDLHGLRYALFEVPNVHRSISHAHGNDDPALTKPAFITFALDRFRTGILYLDCDVVVRSPLHRIAALCHARRDFGIYNWLADEHTDCFLPVEAPGLPPGRFYRFSHSVDGYAPEQLTCSGIVQYWANTSASRGLLAEWGSCISRFPRAADDECLDYAFNNSNTRGSVAYAWLDKAYARYAWWPHVQPVIDHPQFPVSNAHEPIGYTDGRSRVSTVHGEVRRLASTIPRDCLLDVQQGGIFRQRPVEPNGNLFELVQVGQVDGNLFAADRE
jgi:hypothetical protein